MQMLSTVQSSSLVMLGVFSRAAAVRILRPISLLMGDLLADDARYESFRSISRSIHSWGALPRSSLSSSDLIASKHNCLESYFYFEKAYWSTDLLAKLD